MIIIFILSRDEYVQSNTSDTKIKYPFRIGI